MKMGHMRIVFEVSLEKRNSPVCFFITYLSYFRQEKQIGLTAQGTDAASSPGMKTELGGK
ncbi:MAG: hypothetical protein ACYSUX_12940 [Planctomycetota bacterium]